VVQITTLLRKKKGSAVEGGGATAYWKWLSSERAERSTLVEEVTSTETQRERVNVFDRGRELTSGRVREESSCRVHSGGAARARG